MKEVMWFTCRTGTIGIVRRNSQIYIGIATGFDEDTDIDQIYSWGAIVDPSELCEFLLAK